MDTLTCGICLDPLRVPVCTPCGHLCCEACLTAYIESSADAMSASCPTCRASFPIATPDLRFVPKKYHTLILPSIRRVFIPDSSEHAPQHPSSPSNTNRDLRAQVAALTDQVDALVHDNTLLIDRSEAAFRARDAHAHAERELKDLRRKYESLKSKYRSLKHSQENAVPLPLGHSLAPSMPTATTTGKRKSSQPALDALPNTSASSSSSSSSTFGSDYFDRYHPFDLSGDQPAVAHSVLRIPKRPRLLGSPFDLAKRIDSRAARRNPPHANQVRKSRSRMLIDQDEEGDSGFRPSDFDMHSTFGCDTSLGSSSSAGPQRSGLLTGDIFSPSAPSGGGGSIPFALADGEGGVVRVPRSAAGVRSGGGMRPAWMLSPEDD